MTLHVDQLRGRFRILKMRARQDETEEEGDLQWVNDAGDVTSQLVGRDTVTERSLTVADLLPVSLKATDHLDGTGDVSIGADVVHRSDGTSDFARKANTATPYVLWKSDATAAVAGQGASLAAALTELDSLFAGTRVNPVFFGSEVRLDATAYVATTAPSTVSITVCDLADSSHVLAEAFLDGSASGFVQVSSGWVTAGDSFWHDPAFDPHTLALFTENGAGQDIVFRSITLWVRE